MSTIAKGSVVLSLDAQQLNRDLKKTAVQSKAAGKSMADNFKSASGDVLKEKTGGDMGLIGMGMKAGAIGAVIAGVAAIGKGLWDAHGPAVQYAEDLRLINRETELLGESFDRQLGRTTSIIQSYADIAGTAEGMRAAAAGLNELAHQERRTAEGAARMRAELKDSKSWGSLESWGRWLSFGLESHQEGLQNRVTELEREERAARGAAAAERERQRLLRNPEANEAAVASLRQFVQAQNDAADAANGMAAEMIQLRALQRQFNLSANQMAEARSAFGRASAARAAAETRKATEEAAKWIEELELAARGIERTADEARLNELMQRGIDAEQISRLRQLIELRKQLNNQFRPNTAIVRGTAAEISFQARNAFNRTQEAERKRMLEILQQGNGWLGRIYDAIQAEGRKPQIVF